MPRVPNQWLRLPLIFFRDVVSPVHIPFQRQHIFVNELHSLGSQNILKLLHKFPGALTGIQADRPCASKVQLSYRSNDLISFLLRKKIALIEQHIIVPIRRHPSSQLLRDVDMYNPSLRSNHLG